MSLLLISRTQTAISPYTSQASIRPTYMLSEEEEQQSVFSFGLAAVSNFRADHVHVALQAFVRSRGR